MPNAILTSSCGRSPCETTSVPVAPVYPSVGQQLGSVRHSSGRLRRWISIRLTCPVGDGRRKPSRRRPLSRHLGLPSSRLRLAHVHSACFEFCTGQAL